MIDQKLRRELAETYDLFMELAEMKNLTDSAIERIVKVFNKLGSYDFIKMDFDPKKDRSYDENALYEIYERSPQNIKTLKVADDSIPNDNDQFLKKYEKENPTNYEKREQETAKRIINDMSGKIPQARYDHPDLDDFTINPAEHPYGNISKNKEAKSKALNAFKDLLDKSHFFYQWSKEYNTFCFTDNKHVFFNKTEVSKDKKSGSQSVTSSKFDLIEATTSMLPGYPKTAYQIKTKPFVDRINSVYRAARFTNQTLGWTYATIKLKEVNINLPAGSILPVAKVLAAYASDTVIMEIVSVGEGYFVLFYDLFNNDFLVGMGVGVRVDKTNFILAYEEGVYK